MPKLKVTVTVTKEIDLDKVREHYPEDFTLDQMVENEVNYADEMFHEWASADDVQFKTKSELIE